MNLDLVISRLAIRSGSDDKELEVLQTALTAAVTILKDDHEALSTIANTVKDNLGKALDTPEFSHLENEVKTLNAYCVGKDYGVEDGQIEVHRTKRVTATADMEAIYLVCQDEFDALVTDEGSQDFALDALITQGKAVRVSSEESLVEVQFEHESAVEL